jgi:chromosome segregation ATPase
MALWDSIKSALVETEPNAAPTTTQAPQGAAQPTKSGSPTLFQPGPSSINADMVAAIRKQTFSRNTALTALIAASDTLADFIPDPVTRLKAAQKTAGGNRSSKELVDAVQIHLADVDGIERQFSNTLESKVQTEVGGLHRQAEAAEAQITNAQTEIQTLNQRVQQLQQQSVEAGTRLNELRAEAASKETELRQAEKDFKAAAESVRVELNGHKNTILSTLG